MTDCDDIFVEINRLIDEQMEALKKRLTPGEIFEYAERMKRIRQLLTDIGAGVREP
jgi:hypothetical protein